MYTNIPIFYKETEFSFVIIGSLTIITSKMLARQQTLPEKYKPTKYIR